MQHETVQLINGLPVPLEHETASRTYRRNSLCSAEERRRRPGCGHTAARNLMAQALKQTGPFSAAEQACAAELLRQLACLDSRICRLDHQRRHAELRHAALLEEIHPARGLTAAQHGALLCELNRIRAHIEALSNKHTGYVHALRGLRDRILLALGHVM
jgi:hypothetical protein